RAGPDPHAAVLKPRSGAVLGKSPGFVNPRRRPALRSPVGTCCAGGSETIADLMAMARLCLLLLALLAAAPARAETKVLKVAPQTDVVLIDPVFGTALISMIHGLMIYESLFAWDQQFRPQPEMVGAWSTSPDQMTWRFTLRPGLRFHDGAAVTSADVIASL